MEITEYRLFTIVVPTFERGNVLKNSLSHNLPLALPFKDKVRFFVTDNASTDNTECIVKEMMDSYPDLLFYYKHDKNYGAQSNFKFGVANVNSDYVCLLGDEEILSPYFFHYIFSVLKRYPKVAEIHYNFLIGTLDFKGCHLYSQNIVDGFEKHYANGKDFLYEMLNSPTLMSSNVFRRDLWMKSLDKEFETPGFTWFSILCELAMMGECVYFSYPLIIQRFSNINGYSEKETWYFVYGMCNLYKHLDNKIPGLLSHWQEKTQIQDKSFIIRYMMHMSLYKAFYKSRYKKYIRQFILEKKTDILGRMSLVLPYKLVTSLFHCYQRIVAVLRH